MFGGISHKTAVHPDATQMEAWPSSDTCLKLVAAHSPEVLAESTASNSSAVLPEAPPNACVVVMSDEMH
jgi:hypothetical protein